MSREDLPDDENFLSRWSRRKRAIKNASVQDAEQPAESLASLDAVGEEQHEEPLLTDADMPPIESLTEHSDYTGFMSPGVSEELRQIALRKLFHSAEFNVVDGLDDYDEDFTSFTGLGDIVTADMRFQMEQEARRKMDELLAQDDAAEAIEQQVAQSDLQEDLAADPQAETAPVKPLLSEQPETEDIVVETDPIRKPT